MDTALPTALPHGEVTSIRSLLRQPCDDGQVLTFAGPPDPDGRATYWVELCPAHADAGLDGFPTTGRSRGAHPGRCGNVVEFRDFDTILRSHATCGCAPCSVSTPTTTTATGPPPSPGPASSCGSVAPTTQTTRTTTR